MNLQKPSQAWVAMLLVAAAAWPGPSPARQGGTLGPEWRPVDATRLATLRGGFVTPSGLLLSFGIERAVFVNGQLVATARVNVPDFAAMNQQQAQELADMRRTLVVQLGPGNSFFGTGTGAGGVVIQNTLDGQRIGVLTTLHVGVGTLGMFQDLNAHAAMQAALIGAVGVP